jgi:Rrf2 family protein
MHAMAYLANNLEAGPVSTGHVARTLDASEAHLSKVFQRLTKAGLVKSVRGPKGGFTLAWDPAEITLREIYETIDGALSNGDCLLGNVSCDRSVCIFGDLIAEIQARIDSHFQNTTLADLIE